MARQQYVRAVHESRQYRMHTMHLGPNRAQRRSGEIKAKPGHVVMPNFMYRKAEDGTLAPAVK